MGIAAWIALHSAADIFETQTMVGTVWLGGFDMRFVKGQVSSARISDQQIQRGVVKLELQLDLPLLWLQLLYGFDGIVQQIAKDNIEVKWLYSQFFRYALPGPPKSVTFNLSIQLDQLHYKEVF